VCSFWLHKCLIDSKPLLKKVFVIRVTYVKIVACQAFYVYYLMYLFIR